MNMEKRKERHPKVIEVEFTPNIKIYFDSETRSLEVYKDGIYQPDIVEVEIPKLSEKIWSEDMSDYIITVSYTHLTLPTIYSV